MLIDFRSFSKTNDKLIKRELKILAKDELAYQLDTRAGLKI